MIIRRKVIGLKLQRVYARRLIILFPRGLRFTDGMLDGCALLRICGVRFPARDAVGRAAVVEFRRFQVVEDVTRRAVGNGARVFDWATSFVPRRPL